MTSMFCVFSTVWITIAADLLGLCKDFSHSVNLSLHSYTFQILYNYRGLFCKIQNEQGKNYLYDCGKVKMGEYVSTQTLVN